MNTLYLGSKPLNFRAADLIGEGGEAEVYKFGKQLAVKVFKLADHPDYANLPQLKNAAIAKHAERQEKLLSFPAGLPAELVLPQEFLYDQKVNGEIVAYSMTYLEGANPLFCLSQRDFRESRNIDEKKLHEVFSAIHSTLSRLHASGVVVGDFNALNILLQGSKAYFIDTDSMQFGRFLCSVFCQRYVDPLHCDRSLKQPVLVRPLSFSSDWYSFAVMLFESLLYVHPFAGVHKPKNPASRVSPEERVLRGVSVFHPEVQYPSAGVPLHQLNKELLNYFSAVFDGTERQMPINLLDLIVPGAGSSVRSAKPSTKLMLVAEADLFSCNIFTTGGRIVDVVVENGHLNYLYLEEGIYKRESGQAVLNGSTTNLAQLHFKITSKYTAVANDSCLYLLREAEAPERLSVELYRDNLPVFDCNKQSCFWLDGGQIWKLSNSAPVQIHESLSRQTRIFVGAELGFGFYQAGQVRRSFIFDFAGRSKISVSNEVVPANVIGIECYFSPSLIWVLSTRKEGGRLINRCSAIDFQGNLVANQERVMSDDNDWLARLKGKCGAGKQISPDATVDCLFSTVNGGIMQIGIQQGRFVELRKYDSPAINSDHKLVYSEQGLYVWSRNEIVLLSSKRQIACA